MIPYGKHNIFWFYWDWIDKAGYWILFYSTISQQLLAVNCFTQKSSTIDFCQCPKYASPLCTFFQIMTTCFDLFFESLVFILSANPFNERF